MDVAALGLSVDSSQVDKGTLALNKLTGAAGGAQAAAAGMAGGADKMAGAVGKASAAMGLSVDQAGRLRNALGQFATAEERVAAEALQAAGALDEQSAAALRAAQTMRQATAAANDNVSRMGGSFSGLAAQVQDIGVTAAMGMNPMIIALQQGTQIAGQMEMAMQGGGSAAVVFKQALLSLISPISLLAIGLTAVLAAGLQMVDWAWVAQGALNGLATAIEAIGPYAIYAAGTLALIYAPQIVGGIVSLIALMGRLSVSALTAAASFTTAWLAAIGPTGWFILGLAAVITAANIFRDDLARIFGVDVVGAAKDAANRVIAVFVGGYNYIVSTYNSLPDVFRAIGKSAWNAMVDELQSQKILTTPWGWEWEMPDLSGLKSEMTAKDREVMGGVSGSIGDAQKDYLGDFGGAITRGASGAADQLRELAAGLGSVEEAAGAAGGAIGRAANDNVDPWEGMRTVTGETADELKRTEQLAQSLGSTIAGVLRQGGDLWEGFKRAGLDAIGRVAEAWLTSGIQDMLMGGKTAASGGGLFGAALSGLGSLLGFDEGGWTGGHRGQVRGLVHGEEFVVKAGPAARHRQTLEAMNAGRPAPANNNGRSNNVRIEQHFHISGAVSSDDVQRMVRRGAEESVTAVKENLRGWQTDIQLYGKPA